VAIRASSSKQIDALIADLSAASSVARETAVARLTLLGARAVERLLAAAESGARADAGAGVWRTLEAIGDARALEPALAALGSADLDPAVSAAAAGVVRGHLRGARGAAALDRLATVLLDRGRHQTVRLAALRALRELEPSTIAPILTSLADDPNTTIRTEAGLREQDAPRGSEDSAAVVAYAADGALPDDPATLRHALKLSGGTVSLPALVKVVDRVREREGSEPASVRDQWRLVRAAAHVALAHRGSRLALYDLRESLETAKGALPVEFLAALTLIGDATCLEAIAEAYAKAKDAWWREHLARAFRDIVDRERLTKRHAALRRVETRWPGAITAMANGDG
jgi:HEAT repeat protein